MIRSFYIAALIIALLLSCFVESEGKEAVISVTEHGSVSNPNNEDEKCVLLKFDIPQELEDADVLRATLYVKPQFTDTRGGNIGLLIHPFAQNVSIQAASWSLLSNPETNFKREIGAFEFLELGEGDDLRLDITQWFIKCVNDEITNYGFLVKSAETGNKNLSLSSSLNFEGGAVGKVVVDYVNKD